MSVTSYSQVATFKADGVLFDMDGTLTDSIAAVEAAWSAKAEELGLEPEAVIAATHGRRASDNLQELIPSLRKEHVDREVEKFEKSILAFADTPPQSRKNSIAGSERRSGSFRRNSLSNSTLASFGPFTPVSTTGNNSPRRPSNLNNIAKSLDFASYKLGKTELAAPNIPDESPFLEEEDPLEEQFMEDVVDMAVRILPGVKDLINSLPEGKYAVATSGARTYCHGCLKRTDIKIPSVCVTADDPRLTRGKPFPDPFLLAASDLGIDPKKSVIFEDSPSGIKAAVAAGGTVIAVCTSHKREQIDKFGAHYIVDTMEQIKVTVAESGELEFTVKY